MYIVIVSNYVSNYIIGNVNDKFGVLKLIKTN